LDPQGSGAGNAPHLNIEKEEIRQVKSFHC